MNHADSKPVITSVKLFPRLATSVPLRKSRWARPATNVSAASTDQTPDSREVLRTQMRARLLHMILDNERTRRNEQRPSAS
jgi:hypothetical protein